MLHKPSSHPVVILMAFVLAISGCTLDTPDDVDSTPPLELRYTQNLSLVTLHWDAVNVTGFKEYILLQSDQDIPDSPEPEVNTNVTVVKRIDDRRVTSFDAPVSALFSDVCYKLYCAVDDRFIYSQTICVDQEVQALSGFHDRAKAIPDKDQVILFDRLDDFLILYDYAAGEVVSSAAMAVLNFPIFHFSEHGGVPYVYGIDQNQSMLYQFDYPSMGLQRSVSLGQILWNMVPYESFLIVTTEDFQGNHFKLLNRETLATVRSSAGMSGSQNIAIFNGDPTVIYLLGLSQSKKLTLNASGQILSEEFIPITIGQPDIQTSVAQSENYFIGGRVGTIVHRDGEIKGKLVDGINSIVLFSRLSEDEKEVVFITSENTGQRLKIADISALPLITLKTTHDLPALTIGEVILEQDRIYVVGTSFGSSDARTILIQYPR